MWGYNIFFQEQLVMNKKDVITYLKAHPNFLQQHPQLVLGTSIDVNDSAGNLSLVSYQAKTLQKAYQKLERILKNIQKTATFNEQSQKQVYKFIINILKQKTKKDIIDLFNQKAAKFFKLVAVELYIWSDKTYNKYKAQQIAIKRYLDKQGAYFGAMDDKHKDLFFSNPTQTVAILPLKNLRYGAIIWASKDDYFSADNASEILLTFISDVCYEQLQKIT